MMTMKNAMKNLAYLGVRDVAIERLEAAAMFEMAEVVRAAGYRGSKFEWTILLRMIEDAYGSRLIPVAGTYFRRHRRDEDPRRFLAQGPNKHTAGWVAHDERHGPVIRAYYRNREASSVGAVRAVVRQIDTAKEMVSGLGRRLIADTSAVEVQTPEPPIIQAPEGVPITH